MYAQTSWGTCVSISLDYILKSGMAGASDVYLCSFSIMALPCKVFIPMCAPVSKGSLGPLPCFHLVSDFL